MSSTAEILLADLTRAQVKDLLLDALDRPCVVCPNASASWYAELVDGYPVPRFVLDRVERNTICMGGGPIAAVDVTLRTDAYELERTLADEDSEHYREDEEVWLDGYGEPIADLDAYDDEICACAWDVHRDDNLERWTDDLMEQLADHLARRSAREAA